MVSIRIPDFLEKRLTNAAKRAGKTKNACVRAAILKYIEDVEDVYDAERVLQRIRSGKEETVALEDVMKRFGLSPKGV